MQRSKIEWTDYVSNPIKGYCPMACSYCYARQMYDRFGWDKTIRLVPEELAEWSKAKPGSKIFVGSTIELFGDWVSDAWMEFILFHVRLYPKVIFQFLTKQPQNLQKWSPFPKNCWVGVTATDSDMMDAALGCLDRVEASIKFISFEPLLSFDPWWGDNLSGVLNGRIQWLILGGQSGRIPLYPLESWFREIEGVADRAGIPVFEKENLKRNWEKPPRREFPIVRKST